MLMSFKLVLFAVCLLIDNLPSDVSAGTPTASYFKRVNDDSASTLNNGTISTVTPCDDCGIASTNYKSSTSSTTRPDIEDSSELKVNNETCSKCNNQKPSIENITISSFGSNIKISWKPLPETLEVCKYSYEINRTSPNSIIPYFRIEERNGHLFRHVRACEKYNVDIKANNMCSMGFFHNAVVYSAPETIANLQINAVSGQTHVTWDQTRSSECSRYLVQVGRKSYDTEENSFAFEDELYCKEVKVRTIRSDNAVGSETVAFMPGTVRELRVQNDVERKLKITWMPPEDETCVVNYTIIVTKDKEGEEGFNKTVKTTEITVEDLEPCRLYKISVAANSETQTGKYVDEHETTKESVPGSVSNIKVTNETESQLTITWDAPEENSCVETYKVTLSRAEEEDKNVTVKESMATVENLTSCATYDISVATNSATLTGKSEIINGTTKSSVPGPVQKLFATNDNERELRITWGAPEDDSCVKNYTIRWSIKGEKEERATVNTTEFVITRLFSCTLYKVSVTAESDSGPGPVENTEGTTSHSSPDKVVDLKIDNKIDNQFDVTWKPPDDSNCIVNYTVVLLQDSKTLSENEVLETNISFNDLIACTEYLVKVAANTEEEMGKQFVEVKNTTKPSGPDKVVDLKIDNKIANQLDVTWKPPDDSNCIVNYTVVLLQDSKTLSEEEVVETNISFNNLTACTEYLVKVAANTEEEMGKQFVEEKKTTNPSVLNPPLIKKLEVGNMSMTLSVSLESKEENNCKITVWYECLAFEDENPNQNWVKNITLENKGIEKETEGEIILEIDGLSGFTNYTCRVQVENEAGCSEFSEELKLRTEEEVPSSPRNVQTPILKSTIFKLTWEEPDMIPGSFNGYKLEYTAEPLHFIPKSCETYIDSNTSEISEAYFINENARPNYLYTAEVSAKTFDYGKPEKKDFITLSGESEPIRNFTHSISTDSIGCEGPNVTLNLYWLHPCNTNGDIKMFTVQVTSREEKHENTSEAFKEDEEYETRFYLNFYKNYMVNVFTDGSYTPVGTKELMTPEGVPSAPKYLGVKSLNDTSFKISWGKPEMPNGKLLDYDISIQALGSRIIVPTGCTEDKQNYTFPKFVGNSLQFDVAQPFYRYQYQIRANTKVGGGCMESGIIETEESKSEPVRNLNYFIVMKESADYDAKAEVSFDRPCNVNTEQEQEIKYSVMLSGKNSTDTHEETEWLNKTSKLQATFHLKPKFVYSIRVVVQNHKGASDVEITRIFEAPAGVPTPTNTTVPISPESEEGVSVVVEKNLFGEDNGDILYYAIIVGGKEFFNESDTTFGFWDGNNWPSIGKWSPEGELGKYQATPIKWNPFTGKADNEQFVFKLGQGDCDGDICNGVLRPDTDYAVQIRGFTDKAYRDTDAVYFTTKKLQDALSTMAIIGIVAGVLILVMIVGVVTLTYIKRQRPRYASEIEIDKSSLLESLTKENFARYYAKLKEDPESLTNEFADLNNKSVFELTTSEAQLTENRKKNRFINILPYDDGRVKLRNEFSDYINASYILGYSNQIEYIATQGPLESTCKDFWQMVVDENVTVIVMLAQFIEQRKEKCYKYFPDNHDEIQFDENLRVRCSAELDFGHYCERQISVQKDEVQHKLIHLQFMGWPDFGCPVGTENVLDLCIAMRRHVEAAHGLVIVHCSAGVGRTGTLITVDILLQALNYNCREIDVFNTVLELRKQRKNMVQTEAQYLYIYNCICDAIINPPSLLEIKGDPIYENVELKVIKSDDNENTEYK